MTLKKLETWFSTLSVIFISNALFLALWPDYDENPIRAGDAGNRVYQGIFIVIYTTSSTFLMWRYSKTVKLFTDNKTLLILLGFALASITWSVDSAVTSRKALALLGTSAFAFYLVASFTRRELVRIVFVALAAAVFISVLSIVLLPDRAIHGWRDEHQGAWRGMFLHKNQLGITMALTIAVSWAAIRDAVVPRWLVVLVVVTSLVLLIMSQSAGGILTAVLLPFAVIFVERIQVRRIGARVAAFCILGFVVAVGFVPFVGVLEEILNLFRRDLTFTGRTPLWSAAIALGEERAIAGYGYRAFWLGHQRAVVQMSAGWTASQGHNGYLDLWLELGFVGLALFAATLASLCKRLLSLNASGGHPELRYFWIFAIFVLITNLPHSNLLRENSLHWILYVATLVGCSRSVLWGSEQPFSQSSRVGEASRAQLT